VDDEITDAGEGAFDEYDDDGDVADDEDAEEDDA
jgi:hypothetical protein